MIRISTLACVLVGLCVMAGCAAEEPSKSAMKAAKASPEPNAPPTPKPAAPAAAMKAAPAPEPAAPAVREKPSEEACKLACRRILGLAVEEVPEVRRRGAQSFMDAVVDEACPDKCMRSGTRASVACVNAAKTYAEAKACPGTP